MDQLLQAINTMISEMRGLRQDLQKRDVAVCKTQDALLILGLSNPRILTHFHREGLLNRTGGRKGGYVYSKSEVSALSARIRSGAIKVPSLAELNS